MRNLHLILAMLSIGLLAYPLQAGVALQVTGWGLSFPSGFISIRFRQALHYKSPRLRTLMALALSIFSTSIRRQVRIGARR